uniref:Replication protein A subunit n=1 Tax=Trichuris muris TaxID=70415 RepID=A0A5S6QRM4_TRIMR
MSNFTYTQQRSKPSLWSIILSPQFVGRVGQLAILHFFLSGYSLQVLWNSVNVNFCSLQTAASMADSEPALTVGGIKAMLDDRKDHPVVIQIIQLKKIPDQNPDVCRYRLQISDGQQSCGTCMLATQRNELVDAGLLDPLAIVRVSRFVTNTVSGKQFIVLVDLDVLKPGYAVGRLIGEANFSKEGNKPQPTSLSDVPGRGEFQTQGQLTSDALTKSRGPAAGGQASIGSGGWRASQSRTIFPIVSLSPYQNRWCIRARVTQKSAIKTWSNKRGDGKLFSVDLADESGEIRATAFNAECERFYPVLQTKQVYLIQGGTIKVANRQFTSIDNDYELTFSPETQVEPCFDESICNLPEVSFHLTKIKDIENATRDRLIDVLGVVIMIGPVENKIARSTLKELKKRDIRLVDDSGVAISLTLWGNEAEDFNCEMNSLIAVKGCRISEFGGSLSLNAGSNTQIHVNPDIPEAHAVRGWFDLQSGTDEFQNLSAYAGGKAGSLGDGKIMPLGLVEAECSASSEQGDYFTIKGTIMNVNRENCMYPACPSPECSKKVIDQNTGLYRCEKCNKEYPNFTWRLLLNVRICDFSSVAQVTIFQEAAEKLLNIKVSELSDMREQDMQAYDDLFDRVAFKNFLFRLRVKQEMYNDEVRIRFICVRVEEISMPEYLNYLEKSVQELLAMPLPY